jgi:hypothetical protein
MEIPEEPDPGRKEFFSWWRPVRAPLLLKPKREDS